jgi:hypothetical protein
LDGEDQSLLDLFSTSTKERGEPWMTFLETAALIRKLQEMGFSDIQNLALEEANARYFAGRNDTLRVPGLEHVMCARVP